MSLLDALRPGVSHTDLARENDQLREELRQEQDTNLLLMEERWAELELALDDVGWQRISLHAEREFSRDGLRRICSLSRIMWAANPLIKRAVNLRTLYVHGQGVEISATDEAVNEVIAQFVGDRDNRRALFGQQAREEKEKALATDANMFLTLFTHPKTGRVQVRTVPFDEIVDVATNPEDDSEPWYYLRRWTEAGIDARTGNPRSGQNEAWYPDVDYWPRRRQHKFAGKEVRWGSPMKHVRVNSLDGMTFGIPEVYAALGWARAYKDFLEDWASLVKALSRFAWKAKSKGTRLGSLKSKMEGARTPTSQPVDTPAGATAVMDQETDLTPIPKTGAVIDANSGRPLAGQAAIAMDLPLGMLLGVVDDANRAAQQTLDRPTELGMRNRQLLWTSIITDLCDYVIDRSVTAPQGALSGRVTRDEYDRREVLLDDRYEGGRNIDVEWPSLTEHDVKDLTEAVKNADEVDGLPFEVKARLLLTAFGVDNPDDWVKRMVEDADAAGTPDEAAEAVEAVFVDAVERLRETLQESAA